MTNDEIEHEIIRLKNNTASFLDNVGLPFPVPPVPKTYSHVRYAKLVEETITKLKYLSAVKGGEYAGDEDRLANFRRNSERLGMSMEAVWAVYAMKHVDSILQYVKDINAGRTRERSEPLSGRADDIIVYMLLLKAMLEEAGEK